MSICVSRRVPLDHALGAQDLLDGGEARGACARRTPVVMRMQPAQPGCRRSIAHVRCLRAASAVDDRRRVRRRRDQHEVGVRSASSAAPAIARLVDQRASTRRPARDSRPCTRDRSAPLRAPSTANDVDAVRRQRRAQPGDHVGCADHGADAHGRPARRPSRTSGRPRCSGTRSSSARKCLAGELGVGLVERTPSRSGGQPPRDGAIASRRDQRARSGCPGW